MDRTMQTEMELNEIVDGLLRFRFPGARLIQTKTKPVCKDFISSSKDSIHEPPPPGLIFFPEEFFSIMASRHLIDSTDAAYMFSNIDSSKTYRVDSTKIPNVGLTGDTLNLIPEGEWLENNYSSRCFIRVSTPVFNMEFTKAIIAVDYICGPMYGSGYNILLKKHKGKWMIIYEYGTWVS
jgi:hypothetical protein